MSATVIQFRRSAIVFLRPWCTPRGSCYRVVMTGPGDAERTLVWQGESYSEALAVARMFVAKGFRLVDERSTMTRAFT